MSVGTLIATLVYLYKVAIMRKKYQELCDNSRLWTLWAMSKVMYLFSSALASVFILKILCGGKVSVTDMTIVLLVYIASVFQSIITSVSKINWEESVQKVNELRKLQLMSFLHRGM